MGTFETIGFATLAFAATNVDDFFLLLTFFADGRSRTRQIVAGQFLGFAVIVVFSLLAAKGVNLIPDRFVNLLGAVPLLLGIKHFLELRKPKDSSSSQRMLDTTLVSRRKIMAVAGVTLANGADNISAYAPMFAWKQENDTLIALTFFGLVAVWCFATHRLARFGKPVIQSKPALLLVQPVVLIALGIWMLFKFANSK